MAVNDIVILVLVLLSALSGLVSGFVKKTSKIVSLAGAGLVCFYLGGTISEAIVNSGPVVEWLNENPWGSGLVLVGSYVVTFLATFIIIHIVMKIIGGILEGTGPLGKFLDKFLGLAAGVCIGFVLADVYVWILFGLSNVSADIAMWVYNDAKLGLEGVNTLTQGIMNLNLGSIGAKFPL